ncbi:MAG: hypothetical protein FWD63_05635 [Propionibacteriaceae bacterium]|nr:hypothetical protein [Propionibacteriaceae bacterium]
MSILYDDKGLADTCVCDGCGRRLISTDRQWEDRHDYQVFLSDEIPAEYRRAPQGYAHWRVDLKCAEWYQDSENVICPACIETAIGYWLTRKEGNNE